MRIRLLFKWYDFWVGVYYDQEGRNVFIFPLPMFGIMISWGTVDIEEE